MTEAGARDDDVALAVADAHRREWAYVLAATARVACDIDLAEECVQDAYVVGAGRVDPGRGTGQSGRLAHHHRRVTGRWTSLRRDRTLRTKLPLLVEPEAVEPADAVAGVIPDDRLRLVFTCCHPALAREAQVALTLRLVCGLSTAEIAGAFLVSEPTMAARVTRAKKKISAARIAYRVARRARAAGTARRGTHRGASALTRPGTPHRPARRWYAPIWWTGHWTWPGCCTR